MKRTRIGTKGLFVLTAGIILLIVLFHGNLLSSIDKIIVSQFLLLGHKKQFNKPL
jgi:hypothetical protein